LHWVLDICFNEDASRIRRDNAPENMAHTLPSIYFKQDKSSKSSISARHKKAAWDQDSFPLIFIQFFSCLIALAQGDSNDLIISKPYVQYAIAVNITRLIPDLNAAIAINKKSF